MEELAERLRKLPDRIAALSEEVGFDTRLKEWCRTEATLEDLKIQLAFNKRLNAQYKVKLRDREYWYDIVGLHRSIRAIKIIEDAITERTREQRKSIQSKLSQTREKIYQLIIHGNNRVTIKDLTEVIGDVRVVKQCITRLHYEGKIKRVKTFGSDNMIQYVYRSTL